MEWWMDGWSDGVVEGEGGVGWMEGDEEVDGVVDDE